MTSKARNQASPSARAISRDNCAGTKEMTFVPAVGNATEGRAVFSVKRPSMTRCWPPVLRARIAGMNPLTCQGGVHVTPCRIGESPRATSASRRPCTAAPRVPSEWMTNFTLPPVPPVGIITRPRQFLGQSQVPSPRGSSARPLTIVPRGIWRAASARSCSDQRGLPRNTGKPASCSCRASCRCAA